MRNVELIKEYPGIREMIKILHENGSLTNNLADAQITAIKFITLKILRIHF